jgi:hypothetical protein
MTPSPGRVLLSMATAYRTSKLLYVAAKLGIADLVAEGPQTCEEMAASLGASKDALCRVMRGLAVLGIFELQTDGRFAQTELSQPLRSGVDGSVRPGVIFWGEAQYEAWSELLHTVMTGEPAFNKLHGDPFTYYDQHPEAGLAFDSFMALASGQVASGIVYNYEFPDHGTVVDVGGGEGVLLSAILQNNPSLKGILLDRAQVVEKARRLLGEDGLLDRCQLVAGDFRRTVPRGGDIYILRNVIHDWDDAGALSILNACARAMKLSSRLLVIQREVPDPLTVEPYARSLVEADLMQMVYSGGRERTLQEYRALFEAAGLRIHQTMAISGHTWLMEVRKA